MADIGILGGSFNPLHNGHLHLADEFHARLALDRVLLIPDCLPPHKPSDGIAPPDARLRMCRFALRGRPWLAVSDLELRRGGKSYTCDTLRELARRAPGDRFFLLMGADMFLTLERWRHPEELARLSVLCCARRNGESREQLLRYAARLETRFGARCRVVEIPVLPLSSTQVRARVRAGQRVDSLVPPEVARLIDEMGLYKNA